MWQLVIGNIVALVASLLMVYTGIIKNKKKILYFQTIQIGLFVVSNLILGGITGAIINAISCVRNILCYKDKLGLIGKIVISILAITLSLTFNNMGVIGILPLIATISYLWLMNIENVIKFKVLIIFTLILWFIYDLFIKSYSSAIFDFLNIITNLIAIYQLKKKKVE